MLVWRNWQTRMVQVHMSASSCRFKSCHLHQVEYPSGYSIFYAWKKPLALAGTLSSLFAARPGGFSPRCFPFFIKYITLLEKWNPPPVCTQKSGSPLGKPLFDRTCFAPAYGRFFYVRTLPPLFAPKRCYAVAGDQGLKVV